MTDKKPIPVIRAGRDDINMIFSVFACAQELERCEQDMPRRFKAIPNGWRNLRLCRRLLDDLASDLVQTVQPEKLPGIARMAKTMRFKVSSGIEASQLKSDECIVSENDVTTLVTSAHEQCKLCAGDKCGSCPLGRTLDAILTLDRDGGSWATIDLDTKLTGEDER